MAFKLLANPGQEGEPCLKVYFATDAAMNTAKLPDSEKLRIVSVVSGIIKPQ